MENRVINPSNLKAGDIQTDYDKLIDRQFERAAITSIACFSKIYKNAAKKLTY